MKVFANTCAQGDIYIRRVESLPKNVKAMKIEKSHYVVAHSESGHNHVIEARPNVSVFLSDDPMVSYLQVVEATDAVETLLKHMRSFDTHETIKFSPGIYEIRRQREATPEGWRRVED
jgi:hypothetical protein